MGRLRVSDQNFRSRSNALSNAYQLPDGSITLASIKKPIFKLFCFCMVEMRPTVLGA